MWADGQSTWTSFSPGENFIVLAAFSYHFAALQKSYEELPFSDSFSGGGKGGIEIKSLYC